MATYIPYDKKHNLKYGANDTSFNETNFKLYLRDQDYENAANYASQFRLDGEAGYRQRALINQFRVNGAKFRARLDGIEDEDARQAIAFKYAFDNNLELPNSESNQYAERYNNLMEAFGSSKGEVADGITLRMKTGKNGSWFTRFFNIYKDESANKTFLDALGVRNQEDLANLGISVSKDGDYTCYRISKSNRQNFVKFLRASQADGLDEGMYEISGYKKRLSKDGKSEIYTKLGVVGNYTEALMPGYETGFFQNNASKLQLSRIKKDYHINQNDGFLSDNYLVAGGYGDIQDILTLHNDIEYMNQKDLDNQLDYQNKEIASVRTNYKTAEHYRLHQYLANGLITPQMFNIQLAKLDEQADDMLNYDFSKFEIYSNIGAKDNVLRASSLEEREELKDYINRARQNGDRIEMNFGTVNDVQGTFITIKPNKSTKEGNTEANEYNSVFDNKTQYNTIEMFVVGLENSQGVDDYMNDPKQIAVGYANNINNYGASYNTEQGKISVNQNFEKSNKPFVEEIARKDENGQLVKDKYGNVVYDSIYYTAAEMQNRIAADITLGNYKNIFQTNIAKAGGDKQKIKEACDIALRGFENYINEYGTQEELSDIQNVAENYINSLLAPYGLTIDNLR